MEKRKFDLELAKQGKPIITGLETIARILCFDMITNNEYSMVVLLSTTKQSSETVHYYNLKGDHESNPALNLFMAPEKKEGWVNIYSKEGDFNNCIASTSRTVYVSELAANEARKSDRIDCIKIEWYE